MALAGYKCEANLGDILQGAELVRMKRDVFSLCKPFRHHLHLRCVPHLYKGTAVS